MNNVTIVGRTTDNHLDEIVTLHNGTLIILNNTQGYIQGAYVVTSFRNHNSQYEGVNFTSYCSLFDLDNGQFAFQERCSRNTTKRRVLRHLLRLGYTAPYHPDCTDQDDKLIGFDIEVYDKGKYVFEIHTK